MEVSSYIHPPFKIATSWSNGLGMKNVIELCTSDMSRSSRVFAMELHCEFWCRNFGSRLLGIVFVAIFLPLNEVLESSLMPTTVEYFLYFPFRFSVDDYGQWSSILCPIIGSSGAEVSFTTLNTGWSCFIQCGSLKQ